MQIQSRACVYRHEHAQDNTVKDAHNHARSAHAQPTHLTLVTGTFSCMHIGHSLGGAVASLAAFNASLELQQLEDEGLIFSLSMYTYGEPRVGDIDYSKVGRVVCDVCCTVYDV